jgi:flagellar motor switch protein FliG
MQIDIALRLARLVVVPECAHPELYPIVDKKPRETVALRTARLGGVRAAADVINLLPKDAETAVLEAIKAEDSSLGEQIQDALFIFENLLNVDDRGMQTILREVQTDSLALALKGADEAIQEKIFKNMSKRAAEILRDDSAARGPVKLVDVEAAQKEILTVAQRLAEEGQIMLSSGGDDFV